jgi:hypothetical protein
MTKTANITPALIRKVAPPIELYKNPPKDSPISHAILHRKHQ